MRKLNISKSDYQTALYYDVCRRCADCWAPRPIHRQSAAAVSLFPTTIPAHPTFGNSCAQTNCVQILVSSVGRQNPKPVPSGLIHDWMGAAFIPNAKLEDVLSAVRDYGDYKEFYKPTVVDSKLVGTDGACDKYSMRVVNKEAVAETALDMEYETCYFQLDERRWYSITHTTRVREIRHYGKPNEQELPPNQGSGYIWRLYSLARFEERDGGVYVELEAIALSRDIPVALRWVVNPIVRRVSRNSMLISLQQMEEAVRATQAANRKAKPSTVAANRYRGAVASEVRIANHLAPREKP